MPQKSCICPILSYVLEQIADVTLSEKNWIISVTAEISKVCNAVEDHCLQAMKIVHHFANGRFDWLIAGHQNVSPWREAISILSGNSKDLRLSILWVTDNKQGNDGI